MIKKFAIAALALATTAIAAPPAGKRSEVCEFGTYRCAAANTGIEVCNVQSQWELVGECPEGTACEDLDQNGYSLPFCTNKPEEEEGDDDGNGDHEKRNGRPGLSPGEPCPTPGRYDCFGPYAIQVCDTEKTMRFVGNCPERSHCEYLNGIPFCVANY